jgi:hypothetical protein
LTRKARSAVALAIVELIEDRFEHGVDVRMRFAFGEQAAKHREIVTP